MITDSGKRTGKRKDQTFKRRKCSNDKGEGRWKTERL